MSPRSKRHGIQALKENEVERLLGQWFPTICAFLVFRLFYFLGGLVCFRNLHAAPIHFSEEAAIRGTLNRLAARNSAATIPPQPRLLAFVCCICLAERRERTSPRGRPASGRCVVISGLDVGVGVGSFWWFVKFLPIVRTQCSV